MADREQQRRALVEGAADYVMREGLTGLSLRPLAASLETSDRMLLYYFSSKDDLIDEVLKVLSANLQALLGSAIPGVRVSVTTLVVAADALLAAPEMRPAVEVCLELLGLAARGAEPYATAARTLLRDWVAWAERHIDGPARGRRSRAIGAVACIEGILVLRGSGLGEGLPAALLGLLR